MELKRFVLDFQIRFLIPEIVIYLKQVVLFVEGFEGINDTLKKLQQGLIGKSTLHQMEIK